MPRLTVHEVVSKWNTLPDVMKCKRATGVLHTQLHRLCQSHPPEWWDELFAMIPKSKFLSGRVPPTNGRPQFILKLSWLIGPKNLAKVLAGDYDDCGPIPLTRRTWL